MHVLKFTSNILINNLKCCSDALSPITKSSARFYRINAFKKKWLKTDDWERVKSGDDEIPWLNDLPQNKNPDQWTQEEACFGMYDFLHILGNDVTISNKLFCQGPDYIRAYNENELRRLLKKRRELGHRMHIEDLQTLNKRVYYLLKWENHKKRYGHG